MIEIDGPRKWLVFYRAPNGDPASEVYISYRSQSDLDAAMSAAAMRDDIVVWRTRPRVETSRSKELFYARCAFIPTGSKVVEPFAEPLTQADVVAPPAAQAKGDETVPPSLYEHQVWHWLSSIHDMNPMVAKWVEAGWYVVERAAIVTPQEMWAAGWRWSGVAVRGD